MEFMNQSPSNCTAKMAAKLNFQFNGENNMKYFLITLLTLSGCATVSTNPPPDQEFTAVANFNHAAGSQELAHEQAVKTCKHWGAIPGVISSKTIDQSKENIAKEVIGQVSKSALNVRLFDEKHPHQTTLVFKCYQ